MKTSDKLLLTLALLILGVFGAVNLTLYARMKAGHIKNMFSHDGWTRSYEGKTPSRIIIHGNINVTLTPAEKCNVEVQEEAAGEVSCRLSGDSLVISSDDTKSLNPHANFQVYSDRPWVSINMPSGVGLVRLEGQLALLRGSPKPGDLHLDIQAVNSQVWLGESYGMGDARYPAYYYDSVHIQEVNSSLIVHNNADILRLSAQLDDLSELNDLNGTFGSVHLHYAPGSKINIKGATLDKIKVRESSSP